MCDNERPNWTYRVRHNGRERAYEVIERSHVTVRGDGITVMDAFGDSDPNAERKAKRYCTWLQGWDVEDIDANPLMLA